MSFAEHPQIDEFVDFTEQLADAARAFLAERHEGSRFETKEDASPVTEFDRGLEQAMRAMIRESFPGHGIIGEEFEPERSDAEFVWVMDPIDGTKPFVAGIPVFTTLISLCHNGKPVIGVIDAPATGDRWFGVSGRPTLLNGQKVRTSGRIDLDGATLAWSQPDKVLEEHREGHDLINERVAWTVFGAAAYGFGRLAAGAIDVAACSGSIGSYDICALVPIVEGAGGAISDSDGSPITIAPPTGCVAAATPELHRTVIEALAQA